MKNRVRFLLIFISILVFNLSCKKDEAVTPKSSAKDITKFTLATLSPSLDATIDASGKTITASVPAGTDITKLVPSITVSDKATVSPATGVAQDFTNSVTYTVTAEDATSQTYKVMITVSKPAYQIAIDAKYVAMGWNTDGHAPYNGSGPVKTVGGTGYVQYYAFGTRKSAIYYFPSKGAFAMDTAEMNTYDALGQDNWGIVVSDPKPAGTGHGYNDIIHTAGNDNAAGIITLGYEVHGIIYQKYEEMGKWGGPLGYPTSSESQTPTNNPAKAKGVYNGFDNGTIWYFYTPSKAYAIWGKTSKMYAAQDWERGWLGLPTESCDPNKADNKQFVRFEKGAIDAANCGNYYSSTGVLVYKNGTYPTGGALPPCY